jgi:hypothetical protein
MYDVVGVDDEELVASTLLKSSNFASLYYQISQHSKLPSSMV